MGALVDDLLAFSRLSRTPLIKRMIETDPLVLDTLDDMAAERAGRQVELRLGDLPPSLCDPALLKQVWLNLLSNAFKYSRQREAAVVQIGCVREKDENVYFVRDNGTGFDMRYADKLFRVFQRLHRAEDWRRHRGWPGHRASDHSPPRRARLGGSGRGSRLQGFLLHAR